MTGLVIKLKPNEKVLVNGAVLQNGDKAARIRVRSDDVSILRARDAIAPDEANTPLKRIYYVAQIALAGETSKDEARAEIEQRLIEVRPIFQGEAALEIDRAAQAVIEDKFFVVMRAMKKLFEFEDALLHHSQAS